VIATRSPRRRPNLEDPSETRVLVLAAVTVLIGIVSGIGGMLLGLLLRLIQHIAYGYSLHATVSSESFLAGVTSSSPLRRFLALAVCGVVAGAGRWAIDRFGKPLVSIAKSLQGNGQPMPFLSTIADALLQIVTVALGSPLGRELAPRELAALFAGSMVRRAHLPPENCRILIACGAGAGLAAVYNVPLGGALFTLEVILESFSLSAVIPALATSVIAALVARIGLGNATQYAMPPLSISPWLVSWSIAAGPIFGICAYWFVRVAGAARAGARHDLRPSLWWCGTVFAAIGLLAIPFPQLLGNGKGIVQMGFDSQTGLLLAAILFMLKLFVTFGALRAGAEGGLLTPGLALGTMLGIVLGGFCHFASPSEPLGAFAIVGGAAFIASSMKMPITAIVLMIELTRVSPDFVVPLSLAVTGSIAVFLHLRKRGAQPVFKLHHSDIPIGAEAPTQRSLLTPQI
jgi:H+/Cl- antiporter ClcA